jgi:ribosomal protein S18 acetylase RimI-like enzyme
MAISIEIKRATREDALLLSDLSTITFIETYRGSCDDEDITSFIDRCFNEDAIIAELDDADDHYYIAFADGFPAGYMRLKEDAGEYPLTVKYKAIELKRIYVLREYHSQQIGSALISFALRKAALLGYELLWLGVWEENKKAISFYLKHGFTDINQTYPFYVGNTQQTDRWMTKFLNS